MENESNQIEIYSAEKHWFFWVFPSIISLFMLLPIVIIIINIIIAEEYWVFWVIPIIIIIPMFIMIWTALRWKLDKIEYKDGCLYSRLGVIFIDKKAIPLEKISVVSEQTNIIGEWLGVGSLVVQSSATDSTITYECIKKPTKFIEFLNQKIIKSK